MKPHSLYSSNKALKGLAVIETRIFGKILHLTVLRRPSNFVSHQKT